jgi:hypothetical protein
VPEDFLELGSGACRRSLGVRAQAELVEDRGIVRRPALRKQVGHFVNLGLVGQADTTMLLVRRAVAGDESEGSSVSATFGSMGSSAVCPLPVSAPRAAISRLTIERSSSHVSTCPPCLGWTHGAAAQPRQSSTYQLGVSRDAGQTYVQNGPIITAGATAPSLRAALRADRQAPRQASGRGRGRPRDPRPLRLTASRRREPLRGTLTSLNSLATWPTAGTTYALSPIRSRSRRSG